MTRRYALRDDQWERIKDLLPGREGYVGATAKNNRLFALSSVISLPLQASLGVTCHRDSGIFGWFTPASVDGQKQACGSRCFSIWPMMPTTNMPGIDSTIVRAHQQACGCKGGDASTEAIGRSKGGLSTKIHATVDALGNPLSFHLTPGQACDLDGSDQLLPNIVADTVLADKGYDADERVIERLQALGKTAVIPPKRNRTTPRDYDRDLYKARQRD